MIRFVRIEDHVDDGYPSCAFLDTATERFVENTDGLHTFDGPASLEGHPMEGRLRRLVPASFWR